MLTSTLRDYLPYKRAARTRLVQKIQAGVVEPLQITASVEVAQASGVRRIRIRDHQVLSDSSLDYAGFDLGPTSPELQLGVLGSCVAHTVLIHASTRSIPLDAVQVDVSATLDPRGGVDGFEEAPRQPTGLHYTVRVSSPAPSGEIERLLAHVDDVCPVLNLLRAPTQVSRNLQHTEGGIR
ncbi:OsmC family protein [Mycobacterium sp. NPDC003449]